ncbi:5'-nucleotidase [Erysipelotrichaceae bacterium HCN-30851]
MAVSLENCLVIGISSRALFDLDDENHIYETQGLKAYAKYQLAHEDEILKPGSGFALVKALLKLNELSDQRRVEVLIMSRNSADTSLRIFSSLQHYGLDITRAVLSGGAPLTNYLEAFGVDLFLSANEEDVVDALQAGFAAGRIYTNTIEGYDPFEEIDQIRIAFDGDAVLFSDASEQIYQSEGLEAFTKHEQEAALKLLPEGPFAAFLKTISSLQEEFKGQAPIRTALVTARNAPAHERVIRTLRAWNVRIDEAIFLGGIAKTNVLKAFAPHIFFDDQSTHTTPASNVVPSAQVIYK